MQEISELLDQISKLRQEEQRAKLLINDLIEQQSEIAAKVYEITYSQPEGSLKASGYLCMTLDHAEDKAKDFIMTDRRFGYGQHNKALTNFMPALIRFAEKEGYEKPLPEKKLLNRYLNSKNRNYNDPSLIALILKYFGLDVVVVSENLLSLY